VNRSSWLQKHSGFSLVEILIALGLFAVAVVGLLTLFPVALRSEKESGQETQAILIASGIMESLSAKGNYASLRIAIGMNNGLPLWEIIQASKTTNLIIAYDASCQPMHKIPIEEAALPLTDPQVSSIVSMSLAAKSSLPGMMTAEVSVATPAAAPATGRSIRRFVCLLPN
jgi:prepilin-type N-terminal cleavage/methylation domain-containing protein